MAEDKFAVEYFSSAFSLASSFYDGMSHQIVFGPIYEELIPLGLAKKIKTEDGEAALSKAKSSCANIPTFDGGSTTDSTATASSTMRRVKD